MPDSRSHRSAGPADRALFAPERAGALREALAHLAWLSTRGYGVRSALELVGNRFELTARQREALGRSVCSDPQRASRAERAVPPEQLRGAHVALDGYNVLTTVESALGGGLVLRGRDGCLRDLAGLSGTWRRVAETVPSIELVHALLDDLGAAAATWFLDRPVSNSGRLRALIERDAACRAAAITVELVPDADADVLASGAVAVSADRRVLDGCARWFNLAAELIPARTGPAWVVELAPEP